jgi:DNA-binding MarR family transcriptional regulator
MNPMTDSRAELLDRISAALRVLGTRMTTLLRGELDSFQMSLPMAHALRELETPLSMGTLAERLSCDASYITGLADQLEERGLVERRPQPDDRRVKQLVRTEEGQRVAAEVHERFMRAHPIISPLTSEELATMARLLEKAVAAGVEEP